jgi:hypothetical protein
MDILINNNNLLKKKAKPSYMKSIQEEQQPTLKVSFSKMNNKH